MRFYTALRRCRDAGVSAEVCGILRRAGIAHRCVAVCVNRKVGCLLEDGCIEYVVSVPAADRERAGRIVHRERIAARLAKLHGQK